MSTFVYEGGRGGQKSPKNRPRGLCMTPKHKCFKVLKSELVYIGSNPNNLCRNVASNFKCMHLLGF